MNLSRPPIVGVRSDDSLGVAHYAGRLAAALDACGVPYLPCASAGAGSGGRRHFHLANSSRGVLVAGAVPGEPFVVTVHDVLPRSAILRPAYRLWAWPVILRRAAVRIVHSEHAAELLEHHAGLSSHVIAHPVAVPDDRDREAARRRLGIPPGPPVLVMPGVLKAAKLVEAALEAARPLIAAGTIRLVLSGRVADESIRARAGEVGAEVIESPGRRRYQDAIVAADAVLVLRVGSVGEANGPLADALGAHRAVIATGTGSIPEYAGDAAIYTGPSAAEIREAMGRITEPGLQGRLEDAARRRADELTWEASAARHQELFEGVWG